MTVPAIRPARPDDSRAIAALFRISSDGLADYIWQQVAEPGEDLLDVGARRYARVGVPFSWENCQVAVDANDRVIGMAHAFPLDAPENGAPDEEADPVLRPYAELEDWGSLYLSGLALVSGFRGRGIGTRMLEATHARARALGRPRVSLICFEPNAGALRLYRRHGYRELDRRPLVPHPCLHYAEGDALLLARDV